MKRILTALLFACVLVCAVGCGPMKHIINVEMRHPSVVGVDLAGKTVSVVYLEGDDRIGNEFNESMADGFAYTLENDYGTGEGSVGIYRMRQEPEANYASRDSLFNILMDTGADLVFLLDRTKFGAVSSGSVPYTIKMYCFDGMNKEEKVQAFGGTALASANSLSEVGPKGWDAGVKAAGSFAPQWKHEQYTVLYYEEQLWYNALAMTEQHNWRGAMDIWMQQTGSYDTLRRSVACYNLSLACYMLGDYDLALEWLDRSDVENKLELSDTFRPRILSRKR